ncbi:hypothetical protein C8R44DRAFT_824880 [Mycena epipterygia]|nr:hypothetical protein C8R44DRAFT_824880 [Mycena epipterygia]
MVWAFWVQLYYQVSIGYSTVRLTPMFITGLICSVVVALIVGRAPYWALGFPAAVCSIVGTRNSCSRRGRCSWRPAGPGEQSLAGGVFQTMTQLGTSFGVTASTIVFNHVQQGAMRNGADALGSYHAAMWTGVAFGGLATLLALVAFRGVGTIGKDDSHPTPALPLHPSDKDVGARI